MANENIVRKVILFGGEDGKDMILDYFHVGNIIMPDTETGKRLVKRLRLAVPDMSKQQAEGYVKELAEIGITNIKDYGCMSCEDGVLYFHLINKDRMTLDNHNYDSEDGLLAPVREWAKNDHDEHYVDGLSNEQFCHEWNFQIIATEELLTEQNGTPLEDIKQAHTIGVICDSHEKPYCLYQDYDCIAEFDFLDEAQEAYEKAVRWNPDSVIDILSADGEISYAGQN
jgi:hypothetical protein